MKKRSIQSTFLITLISAIAIITIAVCRASIVEVDNLVTENSETILNTTSEMEAAMINKSLSSMRKSVTVMANYINESVLDIEEVKNPQTKAEILKETEDIFTNIANTTESAVAYYFRLNPEITDNYKDGFFFSKPKGEPGFVRYEPTDLSLYEKTDREKVGWYWEPVEKGKPMWMEPYNNQNNDIYMISYVIPLYVDGELLGIVGIDFDFAALKKTIDEIKIKDYKSGYAYLCNDGKIVHHKDYALGSPKPDNSKEYKESSKTLENEMTLVIAASYDDIYRTKYDIITRTILNIAVLGIIAIVVVLVIIRKLVLPIRKLTEETNKIAKGNYSVDIEKSSFAEIEALGETFKLMAKKVQEHDMQQHMLAFRDSLTGLRNTTSYKSWVSEFENEQNNTDASYGLVVLDINYLKETNDTYGHDTGNKLLYNVAQIISGVFKRSPVFRIGGDEFVVVLKDRDLEYYPALLEEMDERCRTEFIESDGEKIQISVAHGVAVYDSQKDKSVTDVFNRADDAMYENKRAMKSKA